MRKFMAVLRSIGDIALIAQLWPTLESLFYDLRKKNPDVKIFAEAVDRIAARF